jgi:hypothetical protein
MAGPVEEILGERAAAVGAQAVDLLQGWRPGSILERLLENHQRLPAEAAVMRFRAVLQALVNIVRQILDQKPRHGALLG